MRRILALLLLLAFGLPWASLARAAAPEAQLPQCCRRDGKHRCAMQDQRQTLPPSSSMLAAKARCGSYPQTQSTAAAVPFVLAQTAWTMAPFSFHAEVIGQAEAGARISFMRSRQERGPPSLLS